MQIIFTLSYEDADLKKCCHRLNLSLKSLLINSSLDEEKFEILVFNFSNVCLTRYIEFCSERIRYYHLRSYRSFSRGRFLNYIIKNHVSASYFYIADVDLIFPPNFIKNLILKTKILKNQNISRSIFLNGNLESKAFPFGKCHHKIKSLFYEMPKIETAQYDLLSKISHKVGWAHGCGVFNRQMFLKLRGFNEEFIGYGPEDGLFNKRLQKVSRVEFDDDDLLKTFHLWHQKFARIQVRKNMAIYRNELKKLEKVSFNNPKAIQTAVIANTNADWGVI